MGLLAAKHSCRLTTDEMTPAQFQEFRSGWIRYEALRLRRDGISPLVALRTAESAFLFMEKDGFTEINEVTRRNRSVA